MPLQCVDPIDGGADEARASIPALPTHYAITAAQLTLIQGWINAGALNN